MIASIAASPKLLLLVGATFGIWIIALLMLVVYLVQRRAMRRAW